MKRIYLSILALVSSLGIYAQGEMDAIKLSRNDLRGTARSVAMGGAFGALGGDISGVAINPAGIGVYSSSEVVMTLNFQNTEMKSNLYGDKMDVSKFKFTCDNFALVTGIDLMSDVVPRLNFGVSYNKIKSFDRKYKMRSSGPDGNGLNGSLIDYMAYRANNMSGNPDLLLDNSQADDSKWNSYDWMGLFGYNGFLINEIGTGVYAPSLGMSADNELSVREKGSINSYDFNVGTTISDIVSLGLTLSVTDIDYRMSSYYREDFWGSVSDYSGYYDLFNSMKTEGAGFQVALGTIIKPINELRIGFAYHSPTFYNMTDYFYADMEHDLSELQGSVNQDIDPNYKPGYIASYGAGSGNNYSGWHGEYDYKLRTPDKFTFSLAGIIDNMAILSVDYDLINYKNMKLDDRYSGDNAISNSGVNSDIKNHFKMSSVLRLGAELRFTPQFSGRLGYSWVQSPLDKDFKDNKKEAMTVGSISHFTLDGDTNYFTWGLGYRFTKNFYTDVAFVVKNQKDYLYAFSNAYDEVRGVDIISDRATLKTTAFQGLLTFGFRF